jgi:GNAT superfamily N-acetyltransferase
MEWQRDDYTITDDPSALDLDFIMAALRTTYWAPDRPRSVMEKALRHSVLLLLRHKEQPIGFVRIVTDYATYAWLCDVFIVPEFRGRGLGKWLMACSQAHPATAVALQMLCTRDAHGLYEKFGFSRRECMVKRVPYSK